MYRFIDSNCTLLFEIVGDKQWNVFKFKVLHFALRDSLKLVRRL